MLTSAIEFQGRASRSLPWTFTQAVRSEFRKLLRQSHPGETLVFYFGNHGDYDRETGEYTFCAFDDDLSCTWVFDAIERDFQGTRAASHARPSPIACFARSR